MLARVRLRIGIKPKDEFGFYPWVWESWSENVGTRPFLPIRRRPEAQKILVRVLERLKNAEMKMLVRVLRSLPGSDANENIGTRPFAF